MILRCSILFLLFLTLFTSKAQDFSIYLMGDAGEPKLPQDKNINYLGEKIATASEKDVLIFLGDNLYPVGLPGEEHPDRQEMEAKLNPQLELIKNFKGRSFIIPGNHDWAQGRQKGWEYVRNMQKYVEEYTGDPNAFQPRNGCPGPEEIQLTEEVTLIIVDTQYFLHSQEKPRGSTECSAGGTSDALELLEDMVIRNADKHIIIAAHHPLYSYGPHGGKYQFWRANLFPLTESKKLRNLYIPLPGLGTIYWFSRAVIGNIQDIPNPKYKAIRNVLLDITSKAENVVWVNGHEHSLQYIKQPEGHFITSGSGSKISHVVKGKGTQFFQKARGFAALEYQKSGEVNLKFWDGDKQELLHEQILYQKDVITDAEELANRPSFAGSNQTIAASEKYDISEKGRYWLGGNYRETWGTPIEVPVFDILSEYDGLDIVKRGGGMQTVSLRLEAKNGRQYVLRSIEKDPTKLLPKAVRKSFAADFLQDQISSSHPYAALAIPTLADAAGVYHTNPSLVYVPSDPAFGKYRYAFENQMFLYEERPNDEAATETFFGEGDDIKGTLDMLDKEIYEDNDNWVDQKFVLRSRLFDMLIGDWDRHDDQWRWVGAKNEDSKGRRYRPIPRDRDQAFFKTEGLIPTIAASKWAVPSSEGFNEEMRWAPGFNWNMRWFDRTFLTEPDWQDWQEAIDHLQANVTDEVIEEALRELPPETYELTAEEIIRILKARRGNMEKYAREYYEYLNREVEVVGSNKHEHFKVERLDDNRTKVTVRKRKKDGDLEQVLYERTFLHDETKEIRLYGLSGQDVFEVDGEVDKGIKVRIIGGKKKDEIIDRSLVRGLGKKTIIYDKKDNTTISASGETSIRLSNRPEINAYDRKSYKYNLTIPLISAQYNPDNGFFLGAGVFHTGHGWRKSPYKSQHLLIANGAVAVDSYNFRYQGKFTDVVGKWGLSLDAEVQEPFFISNFFGFGNDSEYDFDGETIALTDDPIDFYRLRTDRGYGRLGLQRYLDERQRTTFRFGGVFRAAEVDEKDNTFIALPESGVDELKVAEQHLYLGGDIGFNYDTRDHKGIPTDGLLFDANFERIWGANGRSEDLTRVTSSIALYTGIRFPARLVIANRVGVEHLFENDFEFFNASQLGGWTNLRGFRRNRFHGQTAFYHNLDLRLKLFSFTTYIFPGQLGLLAFQDVGRVWIDGENSDSWHVGRGFGVYVAPLSQLAISVEQAFTDEENLLAVRFGFFF